jgi:hypothetical protein
MNHFDRQVLRAMIARAPRMTDAVLTTLLADPEVSPAGRRVLEAEAAARAGQTGQTGQTTARA